MSLICPSGQPCGALSGDSRPPSSSLLRGGNDDVCPIFGSDCSKSPHPIHACPCPGFEMGFGILLGVTYGVVDHEANAGS